MLVRKHSGNVSKKFIGKFYFWGITLTCGLKFKAQPTWLCFSLPLIKCLVASVPASNYCWAMFSCLNCALYVWQWSKAERSCQTFDWQQWKTHKFLDWALKFRVRMLFKDTVNITTINNYGCLIFTFYWIVVFSYYSIFPCNTYPKSSHCASMWSYFCDCDDKIL